MDKMIRQNTEVFAMSSTLGKNVKVEKPLPFSFFYSTMNSLDGPKVKVVFNPERMRQSLIGTLKLYDDWEYIPSENDTHVSKKKIDEMKAFFRKYLILFLLVWEDKLYDTDLNEYLEGNIDLHELITHIDYYSDYQEDMDNIDSIEDLESFCCENNLVNMYGN